MFWILSFIAILNFDQDIVRLSAVVYLDGGKLIDHF
jgi:hypothetical protein